VPETGEGAHQDRHVAQLEAAFAHALREGARQHAPLHAAALLGGEGPGRTPETDHTSTAVPRRRFPGRHAPGT
jgi:hypothetical protein